MSVDLNDFLKALGGETAPRSANPIADLFAGFIGGIGRVPESEPGPEPAYDGCDEVYTPEDVDLAEKPPVERQTRYYNVSYSSVVRVSVEDIADLTVLAEELGFSLVSVS